MHIRPATAEDAFRIAEIEVFNYRLYFYPIFRSDEFYFGELQTPALADEYRHADGLWVYDDGVVKGFMQVRRGEVLKLFVEPILHSRGVGAALLEHAVTHLGAHCLWALEKNPRAISFYRRHGFRLTGERKPEPDTEEFLVRMAR